MRSGATHAALQFRQLECLLHHAYQTVPYYYGVFADAAIDTTQPLTPERWAQIPLLTRQSLQDRADDLLSDAVPAEHGKTFQKKTSGSTGRQIKVTDTNANRLFWQASTLRDHLWHQRDFSGRLVSIRSVVALARGDLAGVSRVAGPRTHQEEVLEELHTAEAAQAENVAEIERAEGD